MKKIILAVAMLLATNITAIAEDKNSNEINMVEAYDIKVNINSLAKCLGLSRDQIGSVEDVQKIFSECLKGAAFCDSEELRKKMVNNVINYDLKHMKYILTEEQYRKYLSLLNATLNNRGIER